MSVADPTTRRTPSTIGSSARLLWSELLLMGGRRRNQAGLAVLASVPILLAVAIRVSTRPRPGHGPDFLSSIAGNGFFVALAALSVELTLFLPLAIATLSGDAIAGEAGQGTLRYLLTVPVGRLRLLVVKYLSLVLGAVVGLATIILAGLAAGGALFGLGPVAMLSGETLSLWQALGRLAIAAGYLTLQLAAVAAIGLFISTLTEQPIAAMIALTLLVTLMWILDGIPQLDWLHPWLLVDRWSAFTDVMRQPIHWATMQSGSWVALGYIAVFLAAAWARFAGKDITS